jgi:egghead protein (zeste-white 4 protein)
MSALLQLGTGWRQVAFGVTFVAWVAAFCFWTGALHTGWAATAPTVTDFWALYGGLATLALVVIRLLSLLAVPQTLLNILGLTVYNAFPERHVSLKSSPLLAPFICVRVVTRGVYPKLVKETVSKNLQTLADVGVENFVIQVVTDTPIHVAGKMQS